MNRTKHLYDIWKNKFGWDETQAKKDYVKYCKYRKRPLQKEYLLYSDWKKDIVSLLDQLDENELIEYRAYLKLQMRNCLIAKDCKNTIAFGLIIGIIASPISQWIFEKLDQVEILASHILLQLIFLICIFAFSLFIIQYGLIRLFYQDIYNPYFYEDIIEILEDQMHFYSCRKNPGASQDELLSPSPERSICAEIYLNCTRSQVNHGSTELNCRSVE